MKCPLCNSECIQKQNISNDYYCPTEISYGNYQWYHYIVQYPKFITIYFPPYIVQISSNEKTKLYYMGNPSHTKFIMEVPYFQITSEDDLRIKIHRLMKLKAFS